MRSSSLRRGHVQFVDHYFNLKKRLIRAAVQPVHVRKPCSQLPCLPPRLQTTPIFGNLFLAQSAIYPFYLDHLLFLKSRSGSPNVGMSYATFI